MPMTALIRCISIISLSALLVACSGFDREYKAAVQKGPPPHSIEGAWDGRWQSQAGHGGGRLRALVTRTGDTTYFARFKANYWGIMQSENDVNLRVTASSTQPAAASTQPVRAAGNEDLGYLKGGVYHYDATLTPTQFDANYSSEHDHGVFTLRRPSK